MVVQGNFSLELINANTRKAFPEHSSSMGKTFVTVSPNVDFMVRLTAQVPDERPIFYQTLVSANGRPRHNFKRRLLDADSFQFSNSTNNSNSNKDQRNVFRFDRTKTSTYESIVMEKVTVRIYEGTTSAANTNKEEEPTRQRRKLLETITIHCCVLPSHHSHSHSDSSSLSYFPTTTTTSSTSLLSLLSLAASGKSQTQVKSRSNFLNNDMMNDEGRYFATGTTTSTSSLISSASRITPEKLLPKKARRLVL